MRWIILFLFCAVIFFGASSGTSQDLLGVHSAPATPTPQNTASGEVGGGGLDGDAP